MKAKHEKIRRPLLFYACVDFGKTLDAAPECWIIPSEVVADAVKESHAAWLAIPGKDHKDSDMRGLSHDYSKFGIGRPLGWLDPYRDAWSTIGAASGKNLALRKFKLRHYQHLTWVGLILPIDDPWWSTHWPPNGWGCQCSIRRITARERARLLSSDPEKTGISYTTEIPDNGPHRTFVNKRTGQVTTVPAGIDPGWGGNPGLDRAQTLATRLTEQMQASGEDDARAAIAAIGASDMPRVLAALPDEVALPVAILPADVGAQLGTKGAAVVEASNRDIGPRGAFYPQIQAAIDDGTLVPDQPRGTASWVARVAGVVRKVVVGGAVDRGRRVLLKGFKPV